MKKKFILALSILFCFACNTSEKESTPAMQATDNQSFKKPTLTQEQAERLADLPLHCIHREFGNKLGQTLEAAEDMGTPQELHPAFYGCFDWHSSVHGHWSLVKIMKLFPKNIKQKEILDGLTTNITKEKILAEVAYFERPSERSYERTYGWSWLLKLAAELHTWEHPMAKELEANLQPLTDLIVARYLEFLPKLRYPIRVGEHTNTAFGLTFPLEYARTVENTELEAAIIQRAKDYYSADSGCPIGWEPSGYDFLSPCLEEANLMHRVLDEAAFATWLNQFLPQLADSSFQLPEGEIIDRTDGKLVHLDGLNFSRAWCLYTIAGNDTDLAHLRTIADAHIQKSLPNLTGDSYEGSHWLASFALAALDAQ